MSSPVKFNFEEPTDIGDELLVLRAQKNPAEFGLLFDRYWDSVFRYCYYRLGDWHRAEDAAGQVFLNAVSALPGYRDPDHENAFRGWLFTIAFRVVSNSRRFSVRHREQTIDVAFNWPASGKSPEEHAIAFEEQELVRTLVSKLKADQRQLVELRLAGLNDAEISRVVGRSPAAVRKAQSRAVFTLRGLIGINTTGTVEASDV